MIYSANQDRSSISNVQSTSMSLDEMIKTIIKAGYEVKKNEYLESG